MINDKIKAVALIISLGCFAAVHAEVHPYVSLKGGLTIANTLDVKASTAGPPAMTQKGEFDLSTGGNIEAAVGMGISGGLPVRIELTGGYQRNDIDGVDDIDQDGKVELATAIANIYFDIVDFESAYQSGPYDTPVVPYFFLGGGMAFSDVEFGDESFTDEVGIFNIGAGVSVNLNEHLVADLQYKYLVSQDLEQKSSSGKTKVQMEASQIQFGLRYMF